MGKQTQVSHTHREASRARDPKAAFVTTRQHGLRTAMAATLLVTSGMVAAQSTTSPGRLRDLIGAQVGGIDKLKVPATLAALPGAQLPDGTDASSNPRYETTEAKRYLGKQIFHDPVRTARIVPEFGGVPATSQTGSCGSCHQGESASKAGTLLNFNVGGQGRGYTDAEGTFIPRRRPDTSILPKLRDAPLFPGDALVDSLPTLTDVYAIAGVSTPARGRRLPDPGALIATGRLDALDSVGRNAPGILGAAFNNRLLLGGFAGELDSIAGALNPFNDPAQENITLLLLDAHRALEAQSAVLQTFPAYRKLFTEAFPAEAAQATASGDLNILINDDTVFRATATFLRSSVTRNTPFDRFINGDDKALTAAQRRGARLFFTPTANGQGGAGCVSCHSGPMLNKQVNDPDVAGVGKFVEENFRNLGLNDHPVQALNRAVRNDPSFMDDGRREITGKDSDAFKFRTVTMRQLKDAKTFMHSGEFTKVRDVVEYFNAGVPRNATSGAAPTLSTRFTNPRGAGYPAGLGLSSRQVDDLTDFLENALYDEAFVKFDPRFPLTMLQLSPVDNLYSVYRPELAALGARDGFPISGLAEDNNDALSRRDAGLEFLNVTSQAVTTRVSSETVGFRQVDVYKITNNGTTVVDTHLLTVARGLPRGTQLANASGKTTTGDPYLRLFLTDGVLQPGQSAYATFLFNRPPNLPRVSYRLDLLSGQGKP
jgi:cytochrome c peroxidase